MAVRLEVALLLQLAAALFFLFLFFFDSFYIIFTPVILFFFHASPLNLSILSPFFDPFSTILLSLCFFLFVAGFLRLVVVCWGCCTTLCLRMLLSVFWRREKPWISGLSPAKHKPGMTSTHIYTHAVYKHSRAEMLLRSKKWKWIKLGELCKKERREAVLFAATTRRCFEQIRNESVFDIFSHNWRHLPLPKRMVQHFGNTPIESWSFYIRASLHSNSFRDSVQYLIQYLFNQSVWKKWPMFWSLLCIL